LQPQRRQGLTGADPTAAGAFGASRHTPFCAVRCDYCAFPTWTDREHLIGDYLSAVRTEISRAVDDGLPAVASVFFGGGTPSLVPADSLMEVLAALPVVDGAEVTVE